MSSLAEHIPGDVFERSDWGAPATPGGRYRNLSEVTQAVHHWTTGTTLGESNQAQWVKNIYDYHTGNRGWSDIGYNYLVDRYGNVYVGRGRFRQGAHAPGANADGMGIALLGGSSEALTDDAKRAINGLMDWLSESVSINQERGHGEVPGNNTSCPGSEYRNWVAAGRPDPDGSEGDPDDGQPDGSGKPDFIVAVVASSEADEGMARVLGKAYVWKFLTLGYDSPHSDNLDDFTVGTAVRVGAAVNENHSNWNETHDVSGANRDETAVAVWERIKADEGDSRNVT